MIPRLARYALALSILLAPAPAMAESTDGIFLSVGLKACKTFTDQRANITDRFTRKALESVYLAWADGFLSGLNARAMVATARGRGGAGPVDLSPAKLSRHDRMRVLINYCLNNPTKNYVQAVTFLYNKFRTASAR